VNFSFKKSAIFLVFKISQIIASEMHEITGDREIAPHDVDTPCRSAG
jgi:hypothetical protein